MARSKSPRSPKMVSPPPRLPGPSPQASSGFFQRGLGWIGKAVLPFLQALAIALTAIGMSLFAVLILLLEPTPQRTREVQQQQPLQVRSPCLAASWAFDAWKSPPIEDLLLEQPLGPLSFHQLHPMDRFILPPSLNAPFKPSAMVAYLDQIQGKISRLWKPPPLRVSGSLSVVVAIRMEASGQLTSATVACSSGDKAFDESALRAIRQAPPFPPPPTDLEDPLQVELRFHASRKERPLRVEVIQERRVPKGEPTESKGSGVETEHIKERLNVTLENPQPS